MLKNLSTIVYADLKDRNPERLQGTCEWFTNHPRFQKWKEETSGLLWVTADPGCGKSVLARHLVDGILPSSRTRSTCYFFFKDDFEEQETAENALRSILRQLFDRQPSLLSDALVAKFEKGGERYFQSFSNLWETLLTLATINAERGKETICILDALDECKENGRLRLASSLSRLYTTNNPNASFRLKFLLTSRPDIYIQRQFQRLREIYPTIHLQGDSGAEVEKISREIELVVDSRLEELARELELSAKEKQALRAAIHSMGNRTYLWVHLIFEDIRASVSITAGSLGVIPQNLPQTVEQAYEKMLRRSSNVGKAKELLQIVVAATRPLTLPEAAIAMAVKEQDREWDDFDMEPEHRFRETVRAICGQFVVIVDSRIYLIHQTARQFLLTPGTADTKTPGYNSTPLLWRHSLLLEGSHRTLAQRCIWYLRLGRKRNHEQWAENNKEKDKPRNAFVEYAVINWTLHYRLSGILSDDVLQSQAQDLCSFDLKSFRSLSWYQDYLAIMALHRSTEEVEAPRRCHQGTPCQVLILSYFGLEGLLKRFLQDNEHCKIDGCDDFHGRDALSWACLRGHENIVRDLLAHISKSQGFLKGMVKWEQRSVVNRPDKYGRRPLHYAAEHGNESMVKMLLDNHADKHCVDSWGITPIAWAEYHRRENIVKILCPSGPARTADAIMLEGALRAALSFMDPERVRLALDRGADINLRDEEDKKPLLVHAVVNGWAGLLSYLLEDPSLDINAEDAAGRSAIAYAIQKGEESTVRQLYNRGADRIWLKRNGLTRLTFGFKLSKIPTRAHVATAQFLLDQGCDANSGSPLIDICSGMNFNCGTAGFIHDIAKSLIENGADLAARDHEGRTALIRAVASVLRSSKKPWSVHEDAKVCKCLDIIELLLIRGADVNAATSMGKTALWGFVEKFGVLQTTSRRLRRTTLWDSVEGSSDPQTTDINRYKGSHAIPMLKLLLKHGADIYATDKTTGIHRDFRSHLRILRLSGDPYVKEIERLVENRAMEIARRQFGPSRLDTPWYEPHYHDYLHSSSWS